MQEVKDMRRLILYRLSLVAISFFLAGCYCPDTEDPINYNQTSISPTNFWIPGYWYEPAPCNNLDYEEEAICRLQQSTIYLADLIDIALSNHPSTQRTWADARAAAYGVGMARSALYPTVTYQGDLIYMNTELDDGPSVAGAVVDGVNPGQPDNGQTDQNTGTINQIGTNPTSSSFTGGIGENTSLINNLNVSYLLLDFGGRCASIEAAKQALYSANWLHNRTIQQVIFNVLQSYYLYSGLAALLEARRADLKNSQANLEAASRLFEAGVKTKLDRLQAQTDLINIELNIVDLQGQIEIEHGRLATAMGIPADTHFHVPSVPKDVAFEKVCAGVEELIAIARYQRPDLSSAYAEQERRRALVAVARSEGLPTITADINLQDSIFFNNPSFNNHSVEAMLSLNVPLFSGYLYYNQVKQAKELVRVACADIRTREQEIAFEIVRSYYEFKTAVESVRFTDEYLKYSQETYHAALLSYQAGVGTILDLLSAQRALANARAEKIRALTRWATALTSISFATGVIGSGQESMIRCRK